MTSVLIKIKPKGNVHSKYILGNFPKKYLDLALKIFGATDALFIQTLRKHHSH